MTTAWSAEAARLPIHAAIDPVRAALAERGRVVLHAPPGAGKTTIIPLVLADEAWCTGTVLMLEPRRLAVRGAATRLAALRGETPGQSVGWRMRQDTRVSAATRIEVITEGVLTRRLQRDPELADVSAVIFDEFHERSLDADVGLALTLDMADALRDDLRIVVMSATLDTDPIAALLDAPTVSSPGRSFPIEVVQVDTDRSARIEVVTAGAVRHALATHAGDVLVFLPGAGEIDRTARALANVDRTVDVRSLYGALSPAAQDAAIAPSAAGRRKVVLATSIAETSLTIEGVTVVIDAGWRRSPRLDLGSGMSRLVTRTVTRAEADQRAGRAGRLAPGTAYRLWDRSLDATLQAFPEPEITVADLTGLALELAAWGASEDSLRWLTPPPPAHLAAARDLLIRLDALGEEGYITAHGRAMAELPIHPRLAHLLLRGAELGHGSTAADVAAVLHESGLRRRRRTDLTDRLRALRQPDGFDRGAVARSRADAKRFRALVGATGPSDPDAAGLVLGLGFPDRVGGARRGVRGDFVLSGGRGAFLDETDPLAGVPYLCAAELDGQATRSRIYLAAPLDEADVRIIGGDRIVTHTEIRWDHQTEDIVAERTEQFDALVLGRAPVRADDVDVSFTDALIAGIRRLGLRIFEWNSAITDLQQRLAFLHRHDPGRWPAADDESILADAEVRIAPYLGTSRRRRDLRRVDGAAVLLHGLDWGQRASIDELAPTRLSVPSGHSHRVDYGVDPPVLAVKLQEMFGSTTTPTVAGGQVRVVLHLLSPAGRPLQVTQDLASFWDGAYAQVRADMRGRYPKHPWPDDPRAAPATARTKRRS